MCERAGHKWIKVSIGRAVTNLYGKKDLIKLDEKKKGMYDAMEHFYQINPLKHPTPQNVEQKQMF